MVAKMFINPIASPTTPIPILDAVVDDGGAPVLVELADIDELGAAATDNAVALLLGALPEV